MAVEPAAALRIAVIGLGHVGRAVARAVRGNNTLTLTAGVDISSAALTAAADDLAGVPLTQDVLTMADADVAIVCAGRRFDRIAPTFRELMARKIPAVSDCPEMLWPWLRHPHLSDVLANEAKKAGVAMVGLGSDPAVATTVLPLVTATRAVTRVAVRRSIQLSEDRPSLRRQIGGGLLASAFRKAATEGLIGLPATAELVVLIAQALGRHPMRADVRTTYKPTLNDDGRVTGLQQVSGYSGNGLDVEVQATAESAASAASDTIEVVGDTTISTNLPGGDVATALIAAACALRSTPAGLRTPLDTLAVAGG